MAEREREGVGDVGGVRDGRETEQPGDHQLHLDLGRGAVAGDRELHLVRAVLDDLEIRLRRREQRDATRLSDRHGRSGIGLKQHPLDDHDIGAELVDQRDELARGASPAAHGPGATARS